MRVLLAIVILAALGWSGFWWFNASARERALTDWLAERRADGWQAEAADLRVTGFPNRVDVLVTDLRLADPEAGWSWHAAELQILSLAWKPHQFIVALPGQQVVATPYETLTATSDLLRGSVAFRPNPRLELDHSTFEIEGMAIASDLGWTAEIGKAILATRQTAGVPFAHDVAFNAESLRLPDGRGRSRRATCCPTASGRWRSTRRSASTARGTAAASRATTRCSGGVEVRKLAVAWGELDLSGSGTLVADAEGYAEGRSTSAPATGG